MERGQDRDEVMFITTDKTKRIAQMITDGSSAKEIADECGCIVQNVYRVARDYDLKIQPRVPKCEQYREQITCMINKNIRDKDIANMLGLTESQVKSYRKQLGIKVLNPNGKHTDGEVDALISGAMPTLRYVGGYVNKDEPVMVRCLVCGTEFSRKFSSLVNQGHISCPECARRQREAEAEKKANAKAEAERRKEIDRQERKRKRISQMVDIGQIELKLSVCPVCGGVAVNRKYCSDVCANKAKSKANEVRRRHKIAKVTVDNDITVQGLFKRDGGVCQICGKPCRLDDYVIANGQKQCGDWYPSIDHIVPLAKGGLHSWDNVQLAHRICNSIKGDKC